MKSLLVLGAGRSSSALIDYLLEQAPKHNWKVTVGDISEAAARERIGNSPHGKPISFDVKKEGAENVIAAHDLVISVLPAMLHPVVAKFCLKYKKHLLTASYVSQDMNSFHAEATKAGLLFLNECGLDPGIDHMSAMQVMDRIRAEGGDLFSFESFTGGLIAPETDPGNPWRYKFTWNPRNVVMAGQGTAKFLQEGQYKYIPYQQLFKRVTPVDVPGYGKYEGYANRDSLGYRALYGLQGIKTMLRGTLRNEGFCAAWDVLVQLGCTDDSYTMEGVAEMTHRSFLNAFTGYHPTRKLEEKIAKQAGVAVDGPEMAKLRWSGFFDDNPVGLTEGTPAQVLEHILNKRWKLDPQDRDLIVMWHRFRYAKDGHGREVQATLIATGDDAIHTAMAKTVGLPLGIAAKLLLEGKIKARGVVVPVTKEFYDPILAELKKLGVELVEK
ncbi:MAG: saccharopine dehydrogenase NADP-binding domain-containing protein [Cyclobacteriaceae bacterium]|nr:saccharopine dehydrogenase NADP-binding domain-containing protein [Cyclobacteriaceae bacterium]